MLNFLRTNLLLSFCLICINAKAQETLPTEYVEIPDPNFEKYLVLNKIDKDEQINGKMKRDDAKNITRLDLINNNIKSLCGIEAFKDLQWLDCTNNQLTNLDLSDNIQLVLLNCGGNNLMYLDLSNNIQLEALSCGGTRKMESLDLSKNINLKYLDCADGVLKKLNISNNTNLQKVDCSFNNLMSLNVDGCTLLTSLNCHRNQITSLNLSNNNKLEILNCDNSKLTYLKLKQMPIKFSQFYVGKELTTVEVEDVRGFFFRLGLLPNTTALLLNLKTNLNIEQTPLNFDNLLTYFLKYNKGDVIKHLQKHNNTFSVSEDTTQIEIPSVGITLKGNLQNPKFQIINFHSSTDTTFNRKLTWIEYERLCFTTKTFVNNESSSEMKFEKLGYIDNPFSFKLRSPTKLFKGDIITSIPTDHMNQYSKFYRKANWYLEQIEFTEPEPNITYGYVVEAPKDYSRFEDANFRKFYRQKEFEKALEELDILIKKYPEEIDFFRLKSNILITLNRYDDAQEVAAKTIKKFKDYKPADLLNLQELYLITNKFQKVIELKTKYYNTIQESTKRMILCLNENFAKHLLKIDDSKGIQDIQEAIPYLKFKDYNWCFHLVRSWLDNSSIISSSDKEYILNLIKSVESEK
ncbi:MAG: hypothetical protein QE277_02600 [Flectobacillus sp.]|nr:hypothetical protein [Flectobacillus sp.]